VRFHENKISENQAIRVSGKQVIMKKTGKQGGVKSGNQENKMGFFDCRIAR
jgi:hypothetical protein